MYRNYPENLGGLGKIWGGLCPPGPSLEPPLVLGRIQELPKFLKYPLLSQERVKLRTSNLAGTFTGAIRTKAHYKFWRKGSVGV